MTSNTNSAVGSNHNGRSSSLANNNNKEANNNAVKIGGGDFTSNSQIIPVESRIETRLIHPTAARLYEKPYLATSSFKIKLWYSRTHTHIDFRLKERMTLK